MSDLYIIVDQPELRDASNLINQYCRTHVITIFAYCKIDYEGRASSLANYADRLILIKPDGVLIIHEREKREPINWQPPGTIISAMAIEDELVIKGIRRTPYEILIIKIPLVYTMTIMRVGTGDFRLWGSESELVERVIKKPNLIEEGFIPLEREYETPYGKIDLLGKDSNGNYVILEFKRGQAQLQAVSQLKRYVDYMREKSNQNIRGGIVAPGITSNAYKLLKKQGFFYVKI
ncbi:MAG: endonuclease NucS [Thermoprotei archaeon]